jgi:hypothetical protein
MRLGKGRHYQTDGAAAGIGWWWRGRSTVHKSLQNSGGGEAVS